MLLRGRANAARGVVALVLALGAGCLAQSSASPAPDAAAQAHPDAAPDPFVRIDAGVECSATDLDDDGFGTGAACAVIDCDDANPLVFPGAPEACNGFDEDCDGEVDEDLGEGSCGRGACRRSAPFCAAGRPAACVPGMPAPETCNAVDDDCDGLVDEEVAGTSCGMGACARTAGCTMGVLDACVPGAPGEEACNRLDDDCDGEVDEGFRATVINGSYSALSGLHAACNAGSRIGQDCNAAMHRACAQQGCTTSGFGPVENTGDTAVYTCVVAAELASVGFAELATAHPGCNGAPQRIGTDCNAAVHRWCAGRGHATGYGPAESGADGMLVACLSPASTAVIETS